MANAHSTGVALLQSGGKVWTTSLDVAQRFGKQHGHVLLAIRNLDCSEEFRRSNFGEIEYTDAQSRTQPGVRMTRDGFSLLAFGFTGKEAMVWKERFLQAFNAMEQQLTTIAAEDRGWIRAMFERQGQVQETLATGLLAFGATSKKLEQVDERVTKLEADVLQFPKSRREIKPEIKSRHWYVFEVRGKRCPCCNKSCDQVEYDHFYNNQKRDFEHTWPICKDCHRDITNGPTTRNDVKRAFEAYQEFAARAIPPLFR